MVARERRFNLELEQKSNMYFPFRHDVNAKEVHKPSSVFLLKFVLSSLCVRFFFLAFELTLYLFFCIFFFVFLIGHPAMPSVSGSKHLVRAF